MPRGSTRSSGGCPAEAWRTTPERGSSVAKQAVEKSIAGERWANSSSWSSRSTGDAQSGPSAATAVRSWPIAAAASSPWPTTSPTATPMRSPGSASVSYQSPPTSSRWSLGR